VMLLVKVKEQVTVKVLLEVKVLVKVFEEVLLFSLSSAPTPTTMPQTRPAARVCAWGAKGAGFPIVAPAPGQRSSGDVSWNTAPALVRRGVGCAGPVRVDPANQNEHRVKPRSVRADTVETKKDITVRPRHRPSVGSYGGVVS